MQEVLCLAAGCLAGFGASWLSNRLRARPTSAAMPCSVPAPSAPAPVATTAEVAEPEESCGGLDSRTVTAAIADELADLASGIEGNAHLLIEACARRGQQTEGRDLLWSGVQRLNRLQGKLRALALPPPAEPGPADVAEVLAAVRSWLQMVHFGLTVELDVPLGLPPVRAGRRVLEDALVCAAECLLLMERGATRLAFSAQLEGDDPEVVIALDLEWTDAPGEELPCGLREAQALENAAARQLIHSQGGSFEVLHMANHHFAQAIVRLPASAVPPPPETAPPAAPDVERPAGARHRYGGVLVLEPDPAIRSMLAAELKARGRNVFACVDGDAVRVLLETTPDRFELLIVDQRTRPEPAHQLAESSARLCPGLKVCLLAGESSDADPPDDLRHRLHRLPKPFGVRDLRTLLEDLLPR